MRQWKKLSGFIGSLSRGICIESQSGFSFASENIIAKRSAAYNKRNPQSSGRVILYFFEHCFPNHDPNGCDKFFHFEINWLSRVGAGISNFSHEVDVFLTLFVD